MRIFICASLCTAFLLLAGCSADTETAKRSEVLIPAGEKAPIGHLTYNVVDSQFLPQLGDEASPRIPHDRFLLVQIAVTNSSNVDNPIPSVELVGDSGAVYNELADGTGVANWLGVVRHVGSGQTERGNVVFDAPAAHYKLRFSDETSVNEVMADLPLSYSHEQTNTVTTDLPEVAPAPAPTPNKK